MSCWSAGNCAFGGNGTGLSSSAIYTFSAGTMATPPTTLTDPAANSFIRSISCVSSSECTVVGADDNGWATANLSGSGWSALGNPAGAPAGGGTVFGCLPEQWPLHSRWVKWQWNAELALGFWQFMGCPRASGLVKRRQSINQLRRCIKLPSCRRQPVHPFRYLW